MCAFQKLHCMSREIFPKIFRYRVSRTCDFFSSNLVKKIINHQTALLVRFLVQLSGTQGCICCQPSWMTPGSESQHPLWTAWCPTRSQPQLDASACPQAASSRIRPWSYSKPSQWDYSLGSSSVGYTSSQLLHPRHSLLRSVTGDCPRWEEEACYHHWGLWLGSGSRAYTSRS